MRRPYELIVKTGENTAEFTTLDGTRSTKGLNRARLIFNPNLMVKIVLGAINFVILKQLKKRFPEMALGLSKRKL